MRRSVVVGLSLLVPVAVPGSARAHGGGGFRDPPRPPPIEAPPPPAPPPLPPPPTPSRPGTAASSLDRWDQGWEREARVLLRTRSVAALLRSSTPAFQRAVRDTMRPALLRAIDPAVPWPPAVARRACLALARTAEDPTTIPVLTALAHGRPDVDPSVRESAVLSLGLLRRTERARQFPAADLDGVRHLLFTLAEDRESPGRVRPFALLALGLLADQPSAEPAGRSVVPRLLAVLEEVEDIGPGSYSTRPDLVAATLRALWLQPAGAVPREVVTRLEGTVRGGTTSRRGDVATGTGEDLVLGHAALALGELGDAESAATLLGAVRNPKASLRLRRCATAALGRLAERVDRGARAEIVHDLTMALLGARPEPVRALGLAALGRMLVADVRAGASAPAPGQDGGVATRLLARLRSGPLTERGWAALALGRLGRAIGDRRAVVERGAIWVDAIRALRTGLADAEEDTDVRGAWAIALGLSRDVPSLPTLLAVLSDGKGDRDLRSHAATAVGLLGVRRPDAVAALRRAHGRREELTVRRHGAAALGLLGVTEAWDELLPGAAGGIDVWEDTGPTAWALAEIGDERSVPVLVRLLEDGGAADLDRVVTCEALGTLADPESVPSLARLLEEVDAREWTDSLEDVSRFL